MLEAGGDGGPSGQAEQADGGVAQGGHDLWGVAGAGLGAVFVEGDVADLLRGSACGPGPFGWGFSVCSEADWLIVTCTTGVVHGRHGRVIGAVLGC